MMWRTLGISEADRQQTPGVVQTKLRPQYHETHSLKLRPVAAPKQLASLTEPTALIKRLNRRIARRQNQLVQLQQQLIETARQSAVIARLNAEIAVVKEKLELRFGNRACRLPGMIGFARGDRKGDEISLDEMRDLSKRKQSCPGMTGQPQLPSA